MTEQKVKEKDVVIIGAGIAGLTAALYAGRMKLDTLVLENALVGGQIANAAGIENYPGFLSVSGAELMKTVKAQAEKYGAVVDEFDEISRMDLTGRDKYIYTDDGIYKAKAVILASGMQRRKLALPEAARLEDKGVHFCELCDGYRYQDRVVAVAGGGNAAVDAAKILAKYARKIYLVHRSELRADPASQEEIRQNPKIEIMLHTDIVGLKGDSWLSGILIRNKDTGEEKELPAEGLFVNIGVIPNNQLFRDQVPLDGDGRILAGEDCRTSLPGVFAAGDIRSKEVRQLTTAAADGTVAATLAEKYIQSLG